MPRYFRVISPAVLLAVTLASVIWGLAVGGAANERALLDPGELVRFGLPLLRTLVNLSIAGLVGSVVMAVWALSTKRDEYRVAMDFAAASAAVMTVASAGTLVFTYMDMTALPFSTSSSFGAALAQFITEIEIGQLWIFQVLLGAVVTVLAFAIRTRKLTLLVLVLALLTTLPLAQQGHAQGASGHAQAVNSLLVHLVGASVWLGGLMTLVFLAKVVDRERIALLVSRYSTLALIAFIGVAASGVVSAWLRVDSVSTLFTNGYGQLVLIKTIAIIVLGGFGAVQRQWLIPRMARAKDGGRFFGWFVAAEFAVLGIANGIAGALGRTATPVPIAPAGEFAGATPAETLTGDPLPPEITFFTYFTEWKWDLAWGLVCFFGLVFYFAGLLRLKHRGDKWPVGRTISWTLGIAALFYTTNGAFNAYERYLFSQHMLAHMMLMMIVPILLVLGAPMTLALRTTERRTDGSWGGREWIMWMVQTPWSKIVTNPIIAAVIFVGSLWIFYFTPIFRWAMVEHLGHQWMIIHFLISGYLFSLTMIGVDPVPKRFPHTIRLVVLFATMASHAFFGVTLMTGDALLLADWFGAMGRDWGADPLADQRAGGGITWGIGEFPTLMLALVVAVQWGRSDTREQNRRDRAADRLGDKELDAYNEMLAKQAERDHKFERGREEAR